MKNPLMTAAVCGVIVTFNSAFAQIWVQTSATSNEWYSVASSADGTKLVAVVNPGSIYTSADSGATWTLTVAPSNAWTSVASSADGESLLAGGGGLVYTSVDSGATWKSNSVPWINANRIFVASSTAGSNLVAAVFNTGIFTSTNAGVTWTSNNFLGGLPWLNAAASANGVKLWAVQDSAPNVWVSTNSGITWTMTSAFNGNWQAVAPTADGKRLVGAVYLTGIWISTNSGATWTKTGAPTINWQAVASSAEGSKLVASAGALYGSYGPGPIYTSTNFGATWISNDAPLMKWASVASSADGNRLVAVAYGGGIWTSHSVLGPTVSITPISNSFKLSWLVPSMDFVLQKNSDLSTTNWVTLPNTPTLNLTNLHNEVFLPLPTDYGFFRLATP
jgi:hypothetical protein